MGGNYAEYTVVPEDELVPIPAAVSFEEAAAALLQGRTAHCLACSTYPVREGDTVLVHAAAGSAGLFLVQIAKRRGAAVIGEQGFALPDLGHPRRSRQRARRSPLAGLRCPGIGC